jgi:hypothetical protein
MHWAVETTGEWKPWFAWYPVRVGHSWRWLRTVPRRRWHLSCEGLNLGSGFDYLEAP